MAPGLNSNPPSEWKMSIEPIPPLVVLSDRQRPSRFCGGGSAMRHCAARTASNTYAGIFIAVSLPNSIKPIGLFWSRSIGICIYYYRKRRRETGRVSCAGQSLVEEGRHPEEGRA